MKKLVLMVLAVATLVTGCGGSNADTVNHNLGKEAEQFRIQRQILFINTITDKVLFKVVGRCSLESNGALPRNLEVICKEGPDSYKKHFLGLADNVSWISTQVEGVDVSEYHTEIIFRPTSIIPDISLETSTQP